MGNKIDLPEGRAGFAKLRRALSRRGIDALPVSAATGDGLSAVLDRAAAVLFGGAA